MARLKGVIKFSGALGELVAYQLNGVWVVRRKSSLDKKRVKTDPAFKNARKASQEFGGASTISKFLRDRWKPWMHKDKDSTVHHRLNSLIYQWIREGQGTRGERTFSWALVAEKFQGFTLNHSENPIKYLSQLPEINRNGTTVNFAIHHQGWTQVPEGATHVQLDIHLLELPEFLFDGKKYKPQTNPSPLITISSGIQALTQSGSFLGSQNVPGTNAYACCLSLTFFQEVNGAYYGLSELPLSWDKILVG